MSSSTQNTDRARSIFNEVLEEFKQRHLDVYKLKDQSKLLLKTISNLLIKVAQGDCYNELKNTANYFQLVSDDIHGFYFEKKPNVDKNEKEANKLMNEFERCLDKHTGINKKINLFELNSQNIIIGNRLCVKNCDTQADQLPDEMLKECYFGCVNELLESMSSLQNEYNQDLQNIINKF